MSMKRSFSARLLALSATACLAATLTVSAPAQTVHHTKKPKKASSTDPLAGVTSKQPDKELFDKAMTALKKGDFSVRLPPDIAGTDGKIADIFNEVVEMNQRMAAELGRISRVVGKEGRISQRASIGEVSGATVVLPTPRPAAPLNPEELNPGLAPGMNKTPRTH